MADENTTSKSKAKSSLPDGVREVTILVGDNVDDATVEDAIRSLAPNVAGITGNYADVQRAGAAIVRGDADGFAAGVEPPPGLTGDDIAVSAAIEKSVEDAKTGKPSSVGDSHTGASITGGNTYNVKGAK